MYKLIVVEDETIIRTAMINNIPWQDIGCTVINDFESAESALEWLNQHSEGHVDIIITDIRMKALSGLDLSFIIQEKYPTIKVIIVTGYGDLKYAKQAIKANVKDFILKPIDPNEIIESINKIIIEIEKDKTKEETLLELKKNIQYNMPLLRQQYISTRLQHANTALQEGNMETEVFLGLDFSQYLIIDIALSDYWALVNNEGISRGYEYKFAVQNALEIVLKDQFQFYIDGKSNEHIQCLVFDCTMDQAEMLCELLQQYLHEQLDLYIDAGISTVGNHSNQIFSLSKQAEEAISYRFYLGRGSIIRFNEISTYKVESEVSWDRSIYQDIITSLSIGDGDQAVWKLKNMWTKISKIISESQLRNLALSMLTEYYQLCRYQMIEIETLIDEQKLYDMIIKVPSCKNLYMYIFNFTYLIADAIQNNYRTNTDNIIAKAISYIEENFMNTITLSDVAEQAYISEKYLCKVLKMKTGKTFKEIQGEYRIKEAIKLMQNTNYKIYEIAEKVGLNDARYFGQLFKSTTGMTPREFRNRKSN